MKGDLVIKNKRKGINLFSVFVLLLSIMFITGCISAYATTTDNGFVSAEILDKERIEIASYEL